jgi:hemerythrin-like metal-binding protein
MIFALFLISFGVFLQVLWLIVCFSTIIVGILLLIFAPGILFLPFNLFFTLGMNRLGKEFRSNSNSKYYRYHFKGEEVMMQEKNFPPYPFHKGEHDKVLSIMNDIFLKWKETNDIQVLKQYFIEELPQWLVQHIQSMDTVTAMFFKTGLSPCSMK